MKKLALALVCLVSVAFFASCDPTNIVENPEPAIQILTGDGYFYDGQVIDYGKYYTLGFRVASNAETQEPLKSFVVNYVSGEYSGVLCDSVISGTEFVYEEDWAFEAKDIVANIELTAIVTDAAGKTNSMTIKLDLNEEEELTPVDFTWNRHGGQAATGNLADLGLEWNMNAKEIYAVITPVDGAVLYRFDQAGRDVWNNVVTASDKAALFSEEIEPIADLREVSCTAPEKEYDIVIGTFYNGDTYLIHITKSSVFTFKGTDVTIVGQYK